MSNAQFTAEVTNYAEAAEALGGRQGMRLGYATRLERSWSGDLRITHHGTPIVTYSADDPDHVTLYTAGWVSRTTAARLHRFTPPWIRINSRITAREEHYILTVVDPDGREHVQIWEGDRHIGIPRP